MKSPPRRLGAGWWALLAVLLVTFAGQVLHASHERTGIDFHCNWAGGQHLKHHGADDLYSFEGRQRLAAREAAAAQASGDERRLRAVEVQARLYPEGLRTVGTPFLFTLMSRYDGVDYLAELQQFQTRSLVAVVVGLAFAARALGASGATLGLLLLFLLSSYQPLLADGGVANVNRFQVGAVGLAVWLAGGGRVRLALAGVVLGLVTMAKPNVGLVAVLLVVAQLLGGRTKAAVALTAGGALGAFVALAWSALAGAGPDAWVAWLGSVGGVGEVSPLSDRNYALGLVTDHWLGVDASLPAWLLVLGWVGVGLLRRRGLTTSRGRVAWALAGGAGLVLLAAPLAWGHYFLGLVPACLWLLRPEVRFRHQLLAVLGLLATSNPAAFVASAFGLDAAQAWATPEVGGLLAQLGVLFVLAGVAGALATRSPRSARSP